MTKWVHKKYCKTDGKMSPQKILKNWWQSESMIKIVVKPELATNCKNKLNLYMDVKHHYIVCPKG